MEDLRDWREKYRPKTMSEVWGNEHVKMIWSGCLRKGNFPMALLLHSNFGTGKTSLAKIFMEDIIKSKGEVFLGEGGIEYGPVDYVFPDIIDRIRNYNSFSIRPHVYFFDEAQRMSEKIQDCLLRIIENNHFQTHIFATTDLAKIDKGIQSRSDKFNLRLPSKEILMRELWRIAMLESMKIESDALDFLIEFSGYIPRECIGNLQIISHYEGVISQQIAQKILT